MVGHALAVEEGHLLLNGAEDAGVAGVQADDEVAAVVVLLHQRALLFKVHVGRRADDGTGLVAFGQCFGDEASGIEDEVGPLQHLAAADADQVGVAGAGADDLDMSLGGGTAEHTTFAEMGVVDGEGCRPVLALHLGDDELAMIGA